MPQQIVHDFRARVADLESSAACAMKDFQPVRFDLEEIFVAEQFLRGLPVRREREPFSGVGADFFMQCRHGALTLGANGFERKRMNLAAAVVGFMVVGGFGRNFSRQRKYQSRLL